MYNSWDSLSNDSKELFDYIFKNNDFEELYYESIKNEENTRIKISEFNDKYPNILTPGNFKDVLKNIEEKQNL